MKPSSHDKVYNIRIDGRELDELKQFTWAMAESFGLDRRIETYQGKRPLKLYLWDLECLEAVTETALEDDLTYPVKAGEEYEAMKRLAHRIKHLCREAFADVDRQRP